MGGGMLWILPTSVGDFAHTDGGDWFNRVKWSVFPKPSLEMPKTEQIKDAQGLFNSTGCLFWWHSEIQELFLPFGKLAIVIGANKWVETEELGRKRHVSLKEPKGKGTGPRDKNLFRFVRDPHYLNCFRTWRQRVLYSREVIIAQSIWLVSGLEEIQPQT